MSAVSIITRCVAFTKNRAVETKNCAIKVAWNAKHISSMNISDSDKTIIDKAVADVKKAVIHASKAVIDAEKADRDIKKSASVAHKAASDRTANPQMLQNILSNKEMAGRTASEGAETAYKNAIEAYTAAKEALEASEKVVRTAGVYSSHFVISSAASSRYAKETAMVPTAAISAALNAAMSSGGVSRNSSSETVGYTGEKDAIGGSKKTAATTRSHTASNAENTSSMDLIESDRVVINDLQPSKIRIDDLEAKRIARAIADAQIDLAVTEKVDIEETTSSLADKQAEDQKREAFKQKLEEQFHRQARDEWEARSAKIRNEWIRKCVSRKIAMYEELGEKNREMKLKRRKETLRGKDSVQEREISTESEPLTRSKSSTVSTSSRTPSYTPSSNSASSTSSPLPRRR